MPICSKISSDLSMSALMNFNLVYFFEKSMKKRSCISADLAIQENIKYYISIKNLIKEIHTKIGAEIYNNFSRRN